MLTLEAKTLTEQARTSKIIRWAVSYRKRYWDIEAQAFTFSGSFVEIPRGEVAMIGPSRDALDRGDVNEFKSSNVTIGVKNVLNKWSKRNPNGVFKPDTTARLGYSQQLMEFKVEVFYEWEDGTESAAIPIFVGHAVNFDFAPEKKTVAITLESKHVLLRRSNAEPVSNPFTNKALVATGDPLVFLTAELGIGRVTNVKVSGSPQTIGVQVTLSDLRTHNKPAKFTFPSPPGATPMATYIQWKRDQKIDALVSSLATQAGIAFASQQISAVVYSNRVLNTKLYTTQADWEGGLTVQNLDTKTVSGQFTRRWYLVDDFSDLDYTANPVWTPINFGGTISAATGALVLANTPGDGLGSPLISTPLAQTTGTWRFRCQFPTAPSNGQVFFFMNGNGHDGFGNLTGTGYGITFNAAGDSHARLNRVDGAFGQTFPSTQVFVADLGVLAAGFHDFRISRDSSSQFKVYIDGVIKATVTDATYAISGFFMVRDGSSGGGTTVDDIYFSNALDDGLTTVTSAAAVFESNYIDGTISFGEWTQAVTSVTAPAGTSITVETATAGESSPGSGVPGAFGAYVAVSPTNGILSAQLRFLKLRITLNVVGLPTFSSPTVFDSTVTFITSSTTIRMADFFNLSCFDAIQKLGEIANYEWGFSRSGVLFFRPRTFKTTPDYTLRLRGRFDFSRITDGVERVFNRIVANYGGSSKVVDSDSQLDSRPHSMDEFGVKTLNIGSSQVLVDPDADIATGLAVSYYSDFSKPRRHFEMEVDFAPQLELADTILLQIPDELPDPPWFVGDSSRSVGLASIHLFGHEQQSAFDVMARVLLASHNPATKRTRLELEEII